MKAVTQKLDACPYDSTHDVKLKNIEFKASSSSYQCAWKPHLISAPFLPKPSLRFSAKTSSSGRTKRSSAAAFLCTRRCFMGGVARVGRGRGCEAGGGEGGARQRLPSLDWSPAPPRGAPCARVGAAQRKRKRARPASPRSHQGAPRAPVRSPGSLAHALPRSPGSLECAHPSSLGRPKCSPQGHQGTLREYPPP